MAETRNDLSGARDRIRESAKWLTASVGAVAAVLVAGTQLSSIGSLALGSTRFWVVVVGGLLALAGVGAVLWSTIAALTAPAVGLHALTGAKPPPGVEDALADPYLLAGRADAAALAADYRDAIAARAQAFREHYADPDDQALRTAAQIADADVTHLDGLVGTLLDVTAYQALAQQWRRSRTTLVAGAAVAAIGISMVAWAANPPEGGAAGSAASPAVLTAPEEATLQLTDAGRAALSEKLGPSCDLDGSLEALVLDMGDAGADVVVTADDCTPTRLLLVPAWGAVG
ncbi:hypothetical protein [Pseudactinotalea suaedae]|uniref:hypothetical protein n=1 Tax=Pseudactinotalea suaedae TaxID=1524924 RepID=UPI0012E0EF56|nr:hypothetical protein [Pseudactinotalea suaedae]